MKRLLTCFLIAIVFALFTVLSASAEVDTDIKLDKQTIFEKEYENKGITGIYDVEMFLPDDENVFKQKTYKNNLNIKNLQSSLFINGGNAGNRTVSEQIKEMNLFSEVKYYTVNDYSEDKDNLSLDFILAILICLAAVVGFLGAKLINKIKKKKEI